MPTHEVKRKQGKGTVCLIKKKEEWVGVIDLTSGQDGFPVFICSPGIPD